MDETQAGITGTVRALSAWKRESQTELGTLLGLSPVSVAQRLNGRLKWTLKDVEKLCQHYGVTYDQLTRGPASWLGHDLGDGDTFRYQTGTNDLVDELLLPVAC